jgi:hypothetical protein
MANFASRSIALGVNPLKASSATQEHKLGHRISDELGNVYCYIQAQGAIAANVVVSIDGSYDCPPSGNAGIAWAVAPVAISDNEYGFVQIKGVVTANVAGSTADNAQLASITDANGDLVTVAAATGTTFAQALAAESGGLASVFIL